MVDGMIVQSAHQPADPGIGVQIATGVELRQLVAASLSPHPIVLQSIACLPDRADSTFQNQHLKFLLAIVSIGTLLGTGLGLWLGQAIESFLAKNLLSTNMARTNLDNPALSVWLTGFETITSYMPIRQCPRITKQFSKLSAIVWEDKDSRVIDNDLPWQKLL
jgi:hypothetical protein